jgi:hypothetical protein
MKFAGIAGIAGINTAPDSRKNTKLRITCFEFGLALE